MFQVALNQLSPDELFDLSAHYRMRQLTLAGKLNKQRQQLENKLNRQHYGREQVQAQTKELGHAQHVLRSLKAANAAPEALANSKRALEAHEEKLQALNARYKLLSPLELSVKQLELEEMEAVLALLEGKLQEVKACMKAA